MAKSDKVAFVLTQATTDMLINARKGNYTAQAFAVIEANDAGASANACAKAIRATGAYTVGNEALGAGFAAAKVQAVNGVIFADATERAAFIADAMENAAKEHAARVAADRQKKATEKAQAEAAGKAQAEADEVEKAKKPLSVLLREKRDTLLAWIEDANMKVSALNKEIESAEATEKAQAEAAGKTQAEADEKVLAEARAILARREKPENAIELESAVRAVETDLSLTERAADFDAAIVAQGEARRAQRKARKSA